MPQPEAVTDFQPDLAAWLAARAPANAGYLLAHAEDGVIWGRLAAGRLTLARDIFPSEAGVDVALLPDTLQQARVFGPGGELRVWRTAVGFAWHVIVESGPPAESFDDRQRLWGTRGERGRAATAAGFTLLVEGRQGLRHAPPIRGLGPTQHAALIVRHYLAYDTDGQAYVVGSRLVDLVADGPAQEAA